MARELTFSMALEGLIGGRLVEWPPIAGMGIDVAGARYFRHRQLIGTSEEALQKGELATLGVGIFMNTDDTNYIELRIGTGGSKFMKLLAGECWAQRLGSDISAPYGIANTDACYLDFLLFEI